MQPTPQDVTATGGNADAMASQGRYGDSEMAHVTPGEIVLPLSIQTPQLMAIVRQAFQSQGLPMDRYVVGGEDNSNNPETGEKEYFSFGKLLSVAGKVASAATGNPLFAVGGDAIGGAMEGGGSGRTASPGAPGMPRANLPGPVAALAPQRKVTGLAQVTPYQIDTNTPLAQDRGNNGGQPAFRDTPTYAPLRASQWNPSGNPATGQPEYFDLNSRNPSTGQREYAAPPAMAPSTPAPPTTTPKPAPAPAPAADPWGRTPAQISYQSKETASPMFTAMFPNPQNPQQRVNEIMGTGDIGRALLQQRITNTAQKAYPAYFAPPAPAAPAPAPVAAPAPAANPTPSARPADAAPKTPAAPAESYTANNDVFKSISNRLNALEAPRPAAPAPAPAAQAAPSRMFSTLTPTRSPRFRSRRAEGGYARNF